MAKKARSPFVGDLRDKDNISTESHMELFRRLIKAGDQGMHGKPGPPKPKKGS